MGKTVCTVDLAEQVRIHIDAQEYFSSLQGLMERAEHTILILGWDIDSRTYLKKGVDGSTQQDDQFFYFIQKLIRAKPHLNVYLLCWNYSIVFSLERELWPVFKPYAWGPRVHFVLDKYHPLLSSHHQKVVVIDETWAFLGGVDLCENRLDNSKHELVSKLRRNALGTEYQPWHDIHTCMSGPIAKKIGLLCRERWFLATGKKLEAPPESLHTKEQQALPFPVHFQNIPVGISRTQPKYSKQRRARENFNMTIELIRRAKKFIYIENQYLTSRGVRKALERSLQSPNGPQIIVVLPKFPFGWLENLTIAILQTRVLRKLREKDIHSRFRAFYPQLHPDEKSYLYVHSKLILVDDIYSKIGSTNINNRSMGLDTEMDLVLEAQDEASHESLKRLRFKLLAEHLQTTEKDLQQKDHDMNLIELIESYQGQDRSLQPHKPSTSDWIDYIIPHIPFFDSPHPIHWSRLVFYAWYRLKAILRQARRRP